MQPCHARHGESVPWRIEQGRDITRYQPLNIKDSSTALGMTRHVRRARFSRSSPAVGFSCAVSPERH